MACRGVRDWHNIALSASRFHCIEQLGLGRGSKGPGDYAVSWPVPKPSKEWFLGAIDSCMGA